MLETIANISSIVLGFLGVALAAKSIRLSRTAQSELTDRLTRLDDSMNRREKRDEDVTDHLQSLKGLIDIADSSAALWNDDRAPRYLDQATQSAQTAFVHRVSTGERYKVTDLGYELMAAVDKGLPDRVLGRRRVKNATSAQIIRQEDLRELQAGVNRYNKENKTPPVDLHTLIGVLNAVIGGAIGDRSAAH